MKNNNNNNPHDLRYLPQKFRKFEASPSLGTSSCIIENPATIAKPFVDQMFCFEAGPACLSELLKQIGMPTVSQST